MDTRRHPTRRDRYATQTASKPSRYTFMIRCAVVIALGIGVLFFMIRSVAGQSDTPVAMPAVVTPKNTQPAFPTIATDILNTRQKKILAVVREEYAKQPVGYDKTVLKYTEGFKESWCADFISWSFNQAGEPFLHPETKYWRIPGVLTLKSYYENYDAYHEVGDGYMPKFGDIAFYFGKTPDGSSTEHVAMILETRGDTIVTIGGNETDKRILKVRYDKMTADVKGLAAIGASGL